ncbi:hypothetical protein [Muribaculum intestinale]|uniref:hypothetical protein n=1 Tax=Muribaculum intestinale TaxID=1796646 RepID=UPI0025A988CB|nr:hypothetical protein [Muribaculum intestinale]
MKDKVTELVTIYAGNESDVEAIIRELAVYRSVYIQRMLHYAFVDIGDSEPEVDWSAYNGKPLFTNGEMSQAILDSSSKRRGHLTEIFAVFLSDCRNLKWLVDKIPEKELRLWRKCLISGVVSEMEVRKALDITGSSEVFIDKTRFSWLYPTPRSIQQFRWSWRKTKSKLEFVIDGLLRPYLLAVLYPEAADFCKLDTLPDNLRVFSDVGGSLKAMSDYDALVAARMFDSGSVHVTLPVIRRVSAGVGLKEFFANDKESKYYANARGRIIVNLMMELFLTESGVSMSPAERCRYVVGHIGNIVPDFVRRALMPQLKGKFANSPFDSLASDMAYRVMRMIARHSEPKKWIESKGFIDYFRMLYGVYGDNLLVDNYSFDRSSMYVKSGVKSGGEHYIALDEKFEYLIVPMIQGVVFMLAAVGAVEVAFIERDAVSCSPFCGLMYWRITELGRFILGITNRYEHTVEIRSVNDFILDDRYLLVTLANPDTSMRGILDRFARPVSANRYAVTAETFLRNCKDSGDIDRTISLIRNFVCPEPPDNWIEFFSRIRRQACAVAPDDTDYEVFVIDREDKELQQYLAMSPEMREIAICAQGFRVLVEMNNLPRFKELLRDKGYLL